MHRSSAQQQIDFETLYRLYWRRIVRFCAACLAACPDGTAAEVRRMQALHPERDIRLLDGPGICKAENV